MFSRFAYSVVLCLAILAPPTQAAAVSVSTSVDAAINIWGAGHTALASLPGGAGTLPMVINIPAGATSVVFDNVDGLVDYGPCCPPNDADGIAITTGLGPSISYQGIAGLYVPRGRFLAGVFLDSSEPADPAPVRLAITDTGFTSLAPGLRQSFFIGDGLTGSGSGILQTFRVPTNATRLFLGFHDSYQGLPGYFNDNTGALNVTASFTVVPLPGALWLFGSGMLWLVAASKRNRCVTQNRPAD